MNISINYKNIIYKNKNVRRVFKKGLYSFPYYFYSKINYRNL